MSDEELVTRAIRDVEPLLNPRGAAHLAAVAVAALSATGRLLPEGGAARVEYGERIGNEVNPSNKPQRGQHTTHVRTVVSWHLPDEPNDNWPKYVGPWNEVTE